MTPLRLRFFGCALVFCAASCSSSAVQPPQCHDDAFAARFKDSSDTLACLQNAGITDPIDLIARAGGGDSSAVRELVCKASLHPCDAAASQGECEIVGALLSHIGDRSFSVSLEELSPAQLDFIAQSIEYDMLDENCSFWASETLARTFPRTWIALGGQPWLGTDRPRVEPLLPFSSLPASVATSEEAWCSEVQFADDCWLPASIEITTKGNGTLSIANLVVRVFDDHDDGSVFMGSLADIVRCTIRGKPTLIVRATRLYTTDGDFPPGTQMPIEMVATFAAGRFDVVHDPARLVLKQ